MELPGAIQKFKKKTVYSKKNLQIYKKMFRISKTFLGLIYEMFWKFWKIFYRFREKRWVLI